MKDERDKRSTFPLPLSSLNRDGAGKTPSYSPAKVATPQTATRNAAHTGNHGGNHGGNHPGAKPALNPYTTPARAASPSQPRSDGFLPHTPVPISSTLFNGPPLRITSIMRATMYGWEMVW